MPYFAAAFARTPGGSWDASEVDLERAETVEDLADLLRETCQRDEPALMFIEENDEWFAIMRIEATEDARTFLSDLRAPLTSGLAAVVYEGVEQLDLDSDEDEPARAISGEPAGDREVLQDLGMSGEELVTITLEEGLLPADALSTISEQLGFADELDKLR